MSGDELIPTGSSEPTPIHPSKPVGPLGLPTNELAGLSVDELCGNKTAVTMLLHYYKELEEENVSLRNDLNTAGTYVQSFRARRTRSRIVAGLTPLGTLLTSFGVNLVTPSANWPGGVLLVGGLCVTATAIYFALDEKA